MKSRIMTGMLICTFVALAACNTVRGAAKDVESAANCTENAINGGQC